MNQVVIVPMVCFFEIFATPNGGAILLKYSRCRNSRPCFRQYRKEKVRNIYLKHIMLQNSHNE
jgi:hypothetical protein